MAYYEKAAGAGKEVGPNKGIINIIKGDYASAVSNYSGDKSFNAALANLLNGNNAVAAILDGSADKDEAAAYYLKAIAGARGGDRKSTRPVRSRMPSCTSKKKRTIIPPSAITKTP